MEAVKIDTRIEEIGRELRLIALAAMGDAECGCDYEGAGGIASALFKVENKLKGLIED
jgi:hypothetical protein